MKGATELPEDLSAALEARPGAPRAFEELPDDLAADLGEWVKAAQGASHRAERAEMVVELVVDHFAKLLHLDLTE